MKVAFGLMQSFMWMLSCAIVWAVKKAYGDIEELSIMMPDVQPDQPESYLCYSIPVDFEDNNYIVKFIPRANMHTVHHMLLYGCMAPALADKIWNCGSMHSSTTISKYRSGSICDGGRLTILYAWAMDAPELEMPEDVGFRIGGNSKVQYLVLQVHYLEPPPKPDSSGLTIHITNEQLPKTAGVLFMATLGKIRAHSKENFEVTCIIREDITVHPFAFRVHTHRLGKVGSGYIVRNRKWHLIGKKNPQEPQMFYPVTNENMTIRSGDIVTARCTMENLLDHDVHVGPTSDDEMCNYYVMYWVDGNTTMTQEVCTTWGPPLYYWSKDTLLANTNIPDLDASTLTDMP